MINQLKKFNKFLEKKLVNKYKMNVLGENDIYRYIGSYPGFIIILLAIIYIVALFYYYLQNFYSFKKDQFLQTTFFNDYQQLNEIQLNEFNFMPYVSVYLKDLEKAQTLDIFSNSEKTIIDWVKMQNFLQFKMVHQHRVSQVNYESLYDFVPCSKDLFDKKNYYNINNFDNKICLDMQDYPDIYNVKNGYIYNDDRKSFSLQIIKCGILENVNCKSDQDIQTLLDSTFLTMNLIGENLAFKEKSLYEKRPVQIGLFQIAQFQLDLDQYLDQNNFIQPNKIITQDSRWNFLETQQEFLYLKLIQKQFFVGKPHFYQYNTKNGSLWTKSQKRQILMSQFFFLDDEIVEHSRKAYNISSIAVEIGGIITLLLLLTSCICIELNYNMIMGDFISTMYFPIMRTKIDEELISNEEAIMKKANLNLSLRDRLDDLIWLAPFLCCCKGRNKKMYQNLKRTTEDQMNIINLVNRQQKLVALVTTIMEQFDISKKMKIEAEIKFRNYINQAYQNEMIGQYNLYKYIDNIGIVDELHFMKNISKQIIAVQKLKSTNPSFLGDIFKLHLDQDKKENQPKSSKKLSMIPFFLRGNKNDKKKTEQSQLSKQEKGDELQITKNIDVDLNHKNRIQTQIKLVRKEIDEQEKKISQSVGFSFLKEKNLSNKQSIKQQDQTDQINKSRRTNQSPISEALIQKQDDDDQIVEIPESENDFLNQEK